MNNAELTPLKGRDSLIGVFRKSNRRFDEVSIPTEELPNYLDDGWTVARQGQRKTRVARDKDLSILFPDRVWCLFYQMGFSHLSTNEGAFLKFSVNNRTINNQLDVVAADEDVALFVECRTANARRKAPKFAEDIAHLKDLRQSFQRAVSKQLGPRKTASLYWSQNILIGNSDLDRAREKGVVVFDESELAYYENLVREIGPAAKYQFLADVFGESRVENLTLTVPAVRIKLGPTRCFSFAIHPSQLLKIAYVSHRSKGKSRDIDTYQRLLKRARIKSIREYIEDDGYFPTNLVVNFRSRRPLEFHAAAVPKHVETTSDTTIGWLTLPASYKSAWVIDGQHRLFAYAGMDLADSAEVSVLAFDNLSERDQARLFIDINSKQKNVPRNLLIELAAQLHWNSDSLDDRLTAIIAKLVLQLDTDADSPFFERIVKTDEATNLRRSISLRTMTDALDKPELFFQDTKAGIVPGAFWQKNAQDTVKRAAQLLNWWFDSVLAQARENWDVGRAPEGAIGMNESVVAIITVLRSIFSSESDGGLKLYDLSVQEIQQVLKPYAQVVASYFGSMSPEQLAEYRRLRGIQGQTTRYREIQSAIRRTIHDFSPTGLDEYLRSRDKNVLAAARESLDKIELALQKHVVTLLQREFGAAEKDWFFKGVPKQVREQIFKRINEEGEDRPKELCFDLIDYRTIALANWKLFEQTLGREKANVSKERRTQWIVDVNERRKMVAHPSKGGMTTERATPEDVDFLNSIWSWLEQSVNHSS